MGDTIHAWRGGGRFREVVGKLLGSLGVGDVSVPFRLGADFSDGGLLVVVDLHAVKPFTAGFRPKLRTHEVSAFAFIASVNLGVSAPIHFSAVQAVGFKGDPSHIVVVSAFHAILGEGECVFLFSELGGNLGGNRYVSALPLT